MSNQRITTKKLKAIVFADVVNFTDISSIDEQKALDLIDKLNTIAKPITVKHNGEWLKELGDGFLISFDSSLEAVRCSIEIQKSIVDIDDLKIRIGIHQGDIFIKDGDVFGDDVNIASRVEGFSPEGGISLSDKVYKDISSVKDIKTAFIGHRKLKGVQQETKIRCITSHNLPKHKMNPAPIIAANICFFLAAINLCGVLYYPLTTLCQECDKSTELYRTIWITINALVRGLTYLLIGYSCLSFSKGISIRSQKLLVYLAYVWIFFPFILGIFNPDKSVITDIVNEGFAMILAFFLILVIHPLITVILFKSYYYLKKRSSLKIFKYNKLAFLLYFLIFILLPILIMAIFYLKEHPQ